MRRAWRIWTAVCLAGLFAGAGAAPAAARRVPPVPGDSSPTVTLTSPADGGLISGGQPFFSGTAGTAPGDDTTVSISVFAGGSATGAPVQILRAAVSPSGDYATGPTTPLPDGLYTAQAAQASTAGTVGMSPAVSFRVANAAPTLTLDPPGSEPQTTGAPTLSGVASTDPGAASTVTIVAYPGTSTNATPVSSSPGSVGAAGTFTVQITPALADGQYTLVATQALATGEAFSAPVSVEIKTLPPALTLTSPRAGADLARDALSYGGAAGNGYGDVDEIDLTMYRGSAATGQPYGTEAVFPTGEDWQAGWLGGLPLGIYTLQAAQHDIAGRATTASVTFLVVPAPTVIGAAVQISQGGVVTVPIGCLASAGSCGGVVLIVTKRLFSTTRGGPRGHLRVLFSGFVVPAGQESVLARRLPRSSFRVLRGQGSQPVAVTVVTSANGGPKRIVTGVRMAKVGS